ncbi:hypothetical protein BDA99DRAFT_559522 [Phascolomyces articulosus]|uniref:Uncharacterized protein n=1 Tax=Phascolomyces articulosus TaxID=60185 RepID=A0AAD5KEQ3_9FUNG|nr:hypothetical protein BDA99DRAFT_559522 [Phascolomyces articulosus]
MQAINHILNKLPRSEVGLTFDHWEKTWPALIHVIREIDRLSHPDEIFDDDEPDPEEELHQTCPTEPDSCINLLDNAIKYLDMHCPGRSDGYLLEKWDEYCIAVRAKNGPATADDDEDFFAGDDISEGSKIKYLEELQVVYSFVAGTYQGKKKSIQSALKEVEARERALGIMERWKEEDSIFQIVLGQKISEQLQKSIQSSKKKALEFIQKMNDLATLNESEEEPVVPGETVRFDVVCDLKHPFWNDFQLDDIDFSMLKEYMDKMRAEEELVMLDEESINLGEYLAQRIRLFQDAVYSSNTDPGYKAIINRQLCFYNLLKKATVKKFPHFGDIFSDLV